MAGGANGGEFERACGRDRGRGIPAPHEKATADTTAACRGLGAPPRHRPLPPGGGEGGADECSQLGEDIGEHQVRVRIRLRLQLRLRLRMGLGSLR